MNKKYIFVTGGVVSGLGKGITAASLGRLLKARGHKVTIQKFDPYINIDAGTMSPYQHGEVFVTDDGAETDLDLGHYERFIDENLTVNNNITAGKIYWSVLNKERQGEYLGATVQVIPHITNAIKDKIYEISKNFQYDIIITEVGGTVGDIESLPFLEAIRQTVHEVGKENAIYVHVTLIPYLLKSGEMKTKPTQHSVKELLSIGIQPDIIICRTEKEISQDMKKKLALFCNIDENCVMQNIDAKSLYEVPILLEKENLADIVCKKLNISSKEVNLSEWINIVNREKLRDKNKRVKIGLVGKYVDLHDAYLSVVEALNHAGIHNDIYVDIKWINSQEIDVNNIENELYGLDGILVPGGFGDRGIEGKIISIRYARENKIPFLGICLGMQCAIIEYSRNVLGYKDADSSELNSNTSNAVIDIIEEQKNINTLGGTMRLGSYACEIVEGTISHKIYKSKLIYERHRHRYEFNNKYRSEITDSGLVISGLSPDKNLVEIIELKEEDHPWFLGVQFHPELKSRPNRSHPIFNSFIFATIKNKKNV